MKVIGGLSAGYLNLKLRETDTLGTKQVLVMQALKDWSLKRKITAVLLGVALVSVTSFATVALWFEWSLVNRMAERHLRITANLLADHVAAETVVGDWAEAERLLASLQTDSSVVAGEIEDENGEIRASFRRSGKSASNEPMERTAGIGQAVMESPIHHGGRRSGALRIQAVHRGPLQGLLLNFGEALAMSLVFSVGVTLLLLRPAKRFIIQPLHDLATTAGEITRSHDFGKRAKANSGDELGRMAESFNAMLAEVQQQEAALKESQDRYQRMFRHSPVPMFIVTGKDYAIQVVNDAAVRTYGYSAAEFSALTLRSLVESDCPCAQGPSAGELPVGTVLECRHRRKDRTTLMVELNSQVSEFVDREAILVQAVDVTEKHRAALALQASEQRFRAVLENLSEGLVLHDPLGRLLYANRRFHELTGRSAAELAETNVRALLPMNPAPSLGLDNCRYEAELARPDGSTVNVLVLTSPLTRDTGEVSATVISLTDLTAAKAAAAEVATSQARLIEVSRLAGMAEVATGVLHNVGNVLNSVNVSANVVVDRLRQSRITGLQKTVRLLEQHAGDLGRFFAEDPKGKLVPDYLGKLYWQLDNERNELIGELSGLTRNLDHIKEIVTMQQSYAKVDGLSEAVSPAVLLEDALRLNEDALVRSQVTVERDYDGSAPKVKVDRHKVLEILVNLVTNARHAVCEADRKDRRIRVRVGPQCNRRVSVEVEDNGIGIPAENLVRVFQHGFTTKKNGHGFGLHSGALAARQMGGSLTVSSAGPGLGASFRLELPTGEDPLAAPTPTASPS